MNTAWHNSIRTAKGEGTAREEPDGMCRYFMNWHELQFEVRNLPPLDGNFWPMAAILRAHQESARAHGGREIGIGIEKTDEQHSVYRMLIHDTPEYATCDQAIVERVVKFLLWMKGGYKTVLYGDEKLGDFLKVQYLPFGMRGFDASFMSDIYGEKFIVRNQPMRELPADTTKTFTIGENVNGCRIGVHIGASDRDCAAVTDGTCVYANEVIWEPAEHDDISYIYRGVVESMRQAAAKLPRVDAIGVSARGIFVNNECRVSPLFTKVPQAIFNAQGRDLFLRAAKEIGAPVTVVSDGQVTALSGSMSIGENNVLGISMGTNESAGYVSSSGHLNTWLNLLGQAPIDLSPFAPTDKHTGGQGIGSLYFSQEGALKLAQAAHIRFDDDLSDPKKLDRLQELMEKGDPKAKAVFESLGMYWGHTVALYYHFYKMRHVLMLGRTLSGKGGETIHAVATRVLEEEYPEAAQNVTLHLPDEQTRRIGQSVAAASL